MKKKALLIIGQWIINTIFIIPVFSQNPNSIDLSGKWKVTWSDGNKGKNSVEDFVRFNPLLDSARYVETDVPFDLNLAMQKRGMFGDINFGTNTLTASWVSRQYWQYYRFFNVPKEALSVTSWLVFDQLDYNAAIYINGVYAGAHKNAFIPCRLNVTGKLKEGKNIITVGIESGLFDVASKEGDSYNNGLNTLLNKRFWLRKPQYQFSWDWNPNMINVGITGNVRLEWKETARLDNIVTWMKFNDDLSSVELTIRPFIQGLSDKTNLTVEATLVETNQKISIQDTISINTRPFELKMKVTNPKLWWPVGQGKQILYTVKVEIKSNGKLIDEGLRRIGFRKIEIDKSAHPVEGNYFTFKINNRKIFLKGGNWVPADMIYSSVDKKRLEKLVDLAVSANFNIIRIWGGGHLAGNDLLDLCDEKGLVVWHDFLFACSEYPGDNVEFYNSVKEEVTWAVREFAHHPSLIIWAGNNENELGTFDWGYVSSGKVVPDYILYHHLIPVILKTEDPYCLYWPSSPYSENYEDPQSHITGDQHPWEVSLGKDGMNFYAYRNYVDRFPNEGGFLGASSPATLRQFLPKDEQYIRSLSWDHHDNLVNFWGDSDITYKTTEFWLGKSYSEMGFDDYVTASALLQAEALVEYITNYHRRKFSSSSAIFWMFNDSWPVTHGWTIVDYYNRKKLAYHPVRRAFAPITVILAEEGNIINIYGVNDNPSDWEGKLQYGIFETKGGYVLNETKDVSLPANVSTVIASFDKTTYEKAGYSNHGAFAVLKKGDVTISQHKLLKNKFKDIVFVKPDITIKQIGNMATLTSPVFVWGACVDINGEENYSDNCFDLYPGIPYTVELNQGETITIKTTGNDLLLKPGKK
jgi:beta-mannosidase